MYLPLVAVGRGLLHNKWNGLFCVILSRLIGRYGVAFDLAIHRPDRKGDQRNHHAHILFTTRRTARDVQQANDPGRVGKPPGPNQNS